jgi:D-alanyl-lipoteichoic acid acyltransferase DltB (MBOAT superfamily)
MSMLYYSPLELALLVMSMAFCTFFGVILGYKLTKYENKKEASMFSKETIIEKPFPIKIKKQKIIPKNVVNEDVKKSQAKKKEDNKIIMPKNMEW